jgi:hypothetical protein
MPCNQRDSQLVMIQEITTEKRKFLEMSYYQRDSQLVMIQETTTEAPKNHQNQERQAVNASTSGAR